MTRVQTPFTPAKIKRVLEAVHAISPGADVVFLPDGTVTVKPREPHDDADDYDRVSMKR